MGSPPAVGVHARPYRNDEADWRAVRRLLIETFEVVPPQWNWDIRRWDGWRFHNAEPVIPSTLAAGIGVWEDDEGRIIGVVHPEGGGDAYLELRPDHRALEHHMLAWAEAHLAVPGGDGRPRVESACRDDDAVRRGLLEARGWTPTDDAWWWRRLDLGSVAPRRAPPVAGGYRLAATGSATEGRDAVRMAALLNAAFGRSIHTPAEYRTFMRRSPSFRHDLNLVAIAPDGSFAAHVGLTYDEENRHGIVEPVCTHPGHRRRGLARTLLVEGVERLRAAGARTAGVETGANPEANALYAACGFTDAHAGRVWRWTAPGT